MAARTASGDFCAISSASVSADYTGLASQEFSSSSGTSTTWSVDTSGGINNAAATAVTFPKLTPSGTGELYFGYAAVANTAAAGTTSGFTYATTADGDVATYDTNVSSAIQPAATQSPSGVSGATAVLIEATGAGTPPPPTTPTVTAVSPTTGSTAGGTTVNVTGTNFTGATAVDFGSTPGTNLVVNSATSITVVAPSGAGTVNVTVTTSSGTSATSTADQYTYSAGAATTVSAVGSLAFKAGTDTTSLAVTPQHVGDLMVLFVKADATGVSVSTIAGGGVTTWTQIGRAHV